MGGFGTSEEFCCGNEPRQVPFSVVAFSKKNGKCLCLCFGTTWSRVADTLARFSKHVRSFTTCPNFLVGDTDTRISFPLVISSLCTIEFFCMDHQSRNWGTARLEIKALLTLPAWLQLAPHRDPADVDPDTGFPDVRWAQTAEVGYTPNAALPNVYTAVAMDLPDFDGPGGS